MLYPIISIGLVVVFVLYLLYMGLIKKDLKSKFSTVVLPGIFFVIVWLVIYWLLFR